MKLIVGTQEEVIKKAAQRYVKLLNEKPEAVLGLATGSTPLGLYAELVKLCAEGKISFAKCTTFNLDEYIGLDGTHDQSYRYFMNKNLFEKVDIRMEATHVPSGAVKSDEEAEQYDAEIKAAGGIDLQLLGIGNNGHIGFNDLHLHDPHREAHGLHPRGQQALLRLHRRCPDPRRHHGHPHRHAG